MGVTVQAKASHSLCEILHLEMDWSNFLYMTFPSNTDPTTVSNVSMASVVSLEVSQMGTLLRDMWQSHNVEAQIDQSVNHKQGVPDTIL